MSKVYIFSGAGLSAESGIPTFRGNDGMWGKHKISEVCDYSTWRKNYNAVHDFYNDRREELASVNPNDMHKAIGDWQNEFGADNVINITTNVDDLLERSGVTGAIHLHGHLTQMQNALTLEVYEQGYKRYNEQDPDVKPNVVFFNEYAPEYQRLHNIVADMEPGDLVIFIGMSFVVIPTWMCLPINKYVATVNVNIDTNTNSEEQFSRVINKPATESINELHDLIKTYMGK